MSVAEDAVRNVDMVDMSVQTSEHLNSNNMEKVHLDQNIEICLPDMKTAVLLPSVPTNTNADTGMASTQNNFSLQTAEAQLVTNLATIASAATSVEEHTLHHTVTTAPEATELVSNFMTVKKVELNMDSFNTTDIDVTTHNSVAVKELCLSITTTDDVECSDESLTSPLIKDEHVLVSSTSSSLLRRHQCSNCSKSFTRGCDLQRHLRIHTGEKPYKCSHCNKAFSQSGSLSAHLRIHTGKKFECRYCQLQFPLHSELLQHVKSHHTGEAPFKCKYCKKLFTSSSTLTTHIRVHTGEKPFSCHICTKSFAHKSDRTKHIRSHTGEKPFKCEVCHKFFSRSTSLTVHRRIHTGEMPFRCSYCMKSFSCSSYLTKHTRTHTGEKPYICKYCDKSFRVSSHLARHIRGHSSLKGFDHKYCKKSNSNSGVGTGAPTTTMLPPSVTVTVVGNQPQLTEHHHQQALLQQPSDPHHQPIEVSFNPRHTANVQLQDIQTVQDLHGVQVQDVQTVQSVPGVQAVQVMEFRYATDETFTTATVDNDVSPEDVNTLVFEDPNQDQVEVTYDYTSSVFSIADGGIMFHGCFQCGKTFFNGSMYRVHLRSHQSEDIIPYRPHDERFSHYNCCQNQDLGIFDF